MWLFFHHIRAFIVSMALISNHVQRNESDSNISLSAHATDVNETLFVSEHIADNSTFRNKAYRDFILGNATGRAFDGRIYILGLFELSTKFGRRAQGYSEIHAARLAIEHINRMNFVQGHRLELLVNDTTCDPGAAIDRFFYALYSKRTISMLLGSACSNVTESLASIVPYWNILQVSYGSTSPILSDRRKFPLFFRTVAPDSSQNDALFALIAHYGWKTVATFSQRENTFMLPLNGLVAKLDAARIDCSTSITFSDSNYKEQLKQLQILDVRIIVASISSKMIQFIFCEAYKMKMYGADYVWFLSEHNFEHEVSKVSVCPRKHVQTALEGVITLAHHQFISSDEDSISGFDNKQFSHMFNNTAFSRLTYDAVWTMALLMRELQRKHSLNMSDFFYDRSVYIEHMLKEMQSLSFVGATGLIRFHGADRIGNAVIKQMQSGRLRTVAYHNVTINKLIFKCYECVRISWHGSAIPVAKRVLHVRLDSTPLLAFYAIGTYCILGLTACMLFFYFNFHYRRIRIIKLSSPRLNNIAVFGCCLVFISVILLGMDSSTLHQKVRFTHLCTARVFLLSAGVSMAFGAIFAKTYRVHRIFTYHCYTSRDKLLQDSRLILLVLLLVAVDGVVVTFWIFFDPLQRRLHNLTLEISQSDKSILFQPQIEVCRCTNTTGWFLAMFGYKGFLMVMGVYMAWETRHIKVEPFNDSQHIGICVYCVVFASLLILLSNFLAAHTLLAYLTQTLSILTATTLTLVLLFVPKLKAIVWEGQHEPIMPGLKIESNTRRLQSDDPNELTYRMLVQNKVYRCELEMLDKEIDRLERELAVDGKSERKARASCPCIEEQVSSDSAHEGNEVFLGKMMRGWCGRFNSLEEECMSKSEETFECASEVICLTKPHKIYIDIEEYI